ncbi:Hypothetical protein SMAX5B_010448 [Scophthalmus maximus]|uniref:Uncharacterized protein n=1 Tax=Scophthalmus maximus TaxID=52904 RepID=A0A2U9BTM2_SCOMX|nr:Hypothetical protein SMAX5B_010448 [Scophthalmus maximus]
MDEERKELQSGVSDAFEKLTFKAVRLPVRIDNETCWVLNFPSVTRPCCPGNAEANGQA